MIIRIVRMTFKSDKVDSFLALFNGHKKKIRHFDGCLRLELLRDAENPSIFYTYSHWKSRDHLDNYRNSSLFGEVWPATKILFADRPSAFSLTQEDIVS